MSSRNKTISHLDWPTVLVYLLLVLIGYAAIYSTSYNPAHPSWFDFSQEYGKQLIWIGLSFMVALIAVNIEGPFYKSSSWGFYGFVLVLLALVLVIGKEINGAKAWISIGSFTIQPSEFAKLATALVLSRFISNSEVKIKHFNTKLKAFLIVIIPIGLVLLQPDVGSAIVAIAFIFPMYREGMSGNIIVVGIVAVFVGVLSVVMSYSTFNYWFVGEQSSLWIFLVVILLVALFALFMVRNTVIPRYRKKYYTAVVLSTGAIMAFSMGTSYLIQSDKFVLCTS